MKKLLGILSALLLIHTVSFAQKIPADTIFANYFKATGGADLWKNIKTYNLKRNYTSASATPYDMNVSASIGDQSMYKSKVIMKRNFEYVVQGGQGWVKVPLGAKIDVKDISQADQDKMKLEIYEYLVPFIDYQNRQLIATTVGPETVNGVATNNVEMQGKGVKYNLYFDAKTGLLVREKETIAGVETVSNFSNYVKSDYGISYPTKIMQINSVDKKQINVTSALTINPVINADLFKR